jgi:hypothetical protein
VTSPPYWGLRDYDDPDQIGSETRVEEYVDKLSKNEKYYYDYESIKEKGVNGEFRNK